MSVAFELRWSRGEFQLDLAAHLEQGVFGLFGPSGSGKSSLLHLLAGIQSPDQGWVRIDNQPVFDDKRGLCVPTYRRGVGVVFQSPLLFPHMSVRQNLLFGEKSTSVSTNPSMFDEMCDLFDLEPLLEREPTTLSGGEAQRVALARTLLARPRVLLLDEPLASMDVATRRHILPYLRRMMMVTRMPVIYVSHDLREILQLTSQLLLIRNGCFLATGPLLELMRRSDIAAWLHTAEPVNVLDLEAEMARPQDGITCWRLPASSPDTIGWVGPLLEKKPGERVRVWLRPEDIALVRQPVADISIRNQIPGKVVFIMGDPGPALCLVDVGVTLMVEITRSACRELALEPGQPVYCLFKAQALRYID